MKYTAEDEERNRTYYVALNKSRNDLFHPYNNKGGGTLEWDNDFRDRVREAKALRRTNGLIEELDSPPKARKSLPTRSLRVIYRRDPVLESIASRFLPRVIDATHIYGLLLCPRRHQYGTLMGAAGMKCDEVERSEFSPAFGSVLHSMIAEFDYATGSTESALTVLHQAEFLTGPDKKRLQNAITSYSEFTEEIGLRSSEGDRVLSEREIYGTIDVDGQVIELRGVIDIAVVRSDGKIDVYDVKTNYLPPSGTSEERLKREFLRKHHERQLLTYKSMLEQQGHTVEGVYVVAVSKKSATQVKWNLVQVDDADWSLQELCEMLPITVEEEGLRKTENKY